jgi:hypothetical protein
MQVDAEVLGEIPLKAPWGPIPSFSIDSRYKWLDLLHQLIRESTEP